MPLSIVSNVLLLWDDGEEGELPVIHAGVQLLVQGLEVIQSSAYNPTPEKVILHYGIVSKALVPYFFSPLLCPSVVLTATK